MIEQPHDAPIDLGIHKWMHENHMVNEKGEQLTFQDHMFMYDPYDDFSQRQVHKKCSQVGASVMMNLKVPYALRTYKWNVIYTLPTDSDVDEFVPTKTDKIIAANPVLKKALRRDNIGLKEMYDRFWHFKGTRSKTAAIMTTADLLIHDEKDRSDQGVLEDYRSRTKKSKYKGLWELSNPSVKNSGVDITWKRSDRREWIVQCPWCDHEQMIDWYRNVDYVKKAYVCLQCGEEIDDTTRRLGRWVKADDGSEISGYHISQMMAPWITAKELIQEEDEVDHEYFSNFVLGEPVGEGDAEDFRQAIIDAWVPTDLTDGPQFMGVDIGATKHYVIGNRDGIHTAGKLKTRLELEMLIEHWNPTVVMDAGPERTWAEEFRRKYPKLHICFYKRDRTNKQKIKWGEKLDAGIVWADRSRTLDMTVTDIVMADLQFSMDSATLEAYIKQWETMIKKKEIDSMGLARFVWDKNSKHAQDHWCHATNYYNIARQKGAPVQYEASKNRRDGPQLTMQNESGEFTMDLKKYMRDKSR